MTGLLPVCMACKGRIVEVPATDEWWHLEDDGSVPATDEWWHLEDDGSVPATDEWWHLEDDGSVRWEHHAAVPTPVVQVFPRERTEGQRVALTGTLLILVGVGLAGVGRVLRGRL